MQMNRLEMAGGAALVCELVPLDRTAWTKTGPSAVEFLFRPGSGMQARPLARIASGGEISRVMLAIKVVLGASDDVNTLVFDEADAGWVALRLWRWLMCWPTLHPHIRLLW